MRIKPEQLPTALQKGLAAIYLLSGDEPLQLTEMADAIRCAARSNAFESREILSVDTGFEWNLLAFSANSRSLFADKKIIDLRLATGTVGIEGAKALINYCQYSPEDTLLLISTAKLSKETLKSKWVNEIDKVGVVIQAWALEGQDLIRWLQNRMSQRGLVTDTEGLKTLEGRIEGNLLAAAQEIEKLYVLYGEGHLSNAQILEVVADSSRYDVFKLADSLLSASANRIIKILSGLQAEGVAAPVVLWALTREARTLIKIKEALAQGQNKELVFRNLQIWDKRKTLVNNALSRLTLNDLNDILLLAAKADRQSKGQQTGDTFETLLAICLRFAAIKTSANSLSMAS